MSETKPLRVPMREPDKTPMYLHVEMLEMGPGRVTTGSGVGSDLIVLEWGDRCATLRGSELLRAWVNTFAPEDAARFPDEIELVEQKPEAEIDGS